MLTFANQKILVIGGNAGIGFATARLAAELGAEVTIGWRSSDNGLTATRALGHPAHGRT